MMKGKKKKKSKKRKSGVPQHALLQKAADEKLKHLNKEKEIASELEEAEEALRQPTSILKKELPKANLDAFQGEGFLEKFKFGLSKTKQVLVDGFIQSVVGDSEVNHETLEALEERLIMADLGVTTTAKIMEMLEIKLEHNELRNQKDVLNTVKAVVYQIMNRENARIQFTESGPTVVLFVGVNGVGKTTTIGKLASLYKKEGKKILVAAGDTFRAAAIDQVAKWCEKTGVDYVARTMNSDPSATIYEAALKAVDEQYDLLLCDTAGRLQTKKNLMDELQKMRRVSDKVIPGSPHHSILVVDATTGQNVVYQTKEFLSLIGIDGLIVTKLDGTAKGGVIIGVVNEFDLPVYYVGMGESVNDLHPFSARAFAGSLFDDSL